MPQVARRGDGLVGVARDLGRDLDADKAVVSPLALEHGPEDVGGGLDVFDQEVPDDRLRVLATVETPRNVAGVGVGALQRFGEDRRVGRDAADPDVAEPFEPAGADHPAVDLVEPDALPDALELCDPVYLVHGVLPNIERLSELMPLASTLGIRSDEYTPERVVLSLEWAPCVIMALADSAGGACAYLNLPADAAGTSTIESKTNFLGAAREGWVTATATPLHRGRTTIVVETAVHDKAGKLIAKVTQTQLVLRPLA